MNNDLSDLGSTHRNPPIILKQTEFYLKQFAKTIGQAKYSVFNKSKTVCVAGFLEKKHRSIIWGQSHWKQLWDAPLQWETAVADFLVTFENWLPLDNFDHAKWIKPQWVAMCWTNVQVKFVRRGNRKAKDKGNVKQEQERIQASAWVRWREVTPQHDKMNCSWLWFAGCQVATNALCPTIAFNACIQRWQAATWWLNLLTSTAAQMSHTFSHRRSSAAWSRMNWTHSIWNYIHTEKWYLASYIARFCTTVALQMLSSWYFDWIWIYFLTEVRELQGRWLRST